MASRAGAAGVAGRRSAPGSAVGGAPDGRADVEKRTSDPHRVLPFLVLAGLALPLSQTLAVPALPLLSERYDAGPAAISWVLTAVLLVATVGTPVIARLGDLRGRRPVLIGVLIVFCVGTVIAATATSLALLIAGRALQGVAAAIFPLAFGLIRETFDADRVIGGVTAVGVMMGIGSGLGLPLAGVVAEYLPLPWAFWPALVVLPAIPAVWWLAPRRAPTAGVPPVDWRGGALLGLCLGAALIAISQLGDWGLRSWPTLGVAALAVAAGAAFLRWERRAPAPLMDLAVMGRPRVVVLNLIAGLAGLSVVAGFMLMPAHATASGGLAVSVAVAGGLLVPFGLLQLASGIGAAAIERRIGFFPMLVLGCVGLGGGQVLLALTRDVGAMLIGGGLVGLGMGLAYAALTGLIVTAVPERDVGVASGFNVVMRMMGGAFGSAMVGAVLAGSADVVADASPGSFTLAFALSGVASVLGVGLAVGLRRIRRAAGPPVGEMSG